MRESPQDLTLVIKKSALFWMTKEGHREERLGRPALTSRNSLDPAPRPSRPFEGGVYYFVKCIYHRVMFSPPAGLTGVEHDGMECEPQEIRPGGWQTKSRLLRAALSGERSRHGELKCRFVSFVRRGSSFEIPRKPSSLHSERVLTGWGVE